MGASTSSRTAWRSRTIAALVASFASIAYVQCGGDKSPTPTQPTVPPPTTVLPIPPPTPTPSPSPPQIFVGAGDIGWNNNGGGQEQTARLIDSIGGTVFTTGDNAYLDGSARNYSDWYNASWGRFRDRTRPVPGNHEYDTDHSMAGYFGYFGTAAGGFPGYYSHELGDWHAIALNSSIDVTGGSPQATWLRGDLVAHPSKCTIAYWHFPLFTSGPNGNQTQMRAIWQILYDNNVDVIVNGHDHLYERFAPQAPDGFPDPIRGIREFIVGTGGAVLYEIVTNMPNSERRIAGVYGVLKFTLSDGGYDWQFIPVSGGQSDAGHGTCH